MNEGVEETEFDTINIILQQHWLLETLLEGRRKYMFFSQTCHYSYDLQTVLFAIWHDFSKNKWKDLPFFNSIFPQFSSSCLQSNIIFS